ncbi:MAG: type II toxin-antitoxin system VapC family toxin [Kiloniellales bacterium]
MSGPYLDTSALAKWYLNEPESDRFEAFVKEQAEASISRLTVVELRCLLSRRRRAREISRKTEQAAFALFQNDILSGHLQLHPLRDEHGAEAVALIEQLGGHALRALDALHLVIARDIGARILATADRTMARAAPDLGLEVAFFG